MVHFYKVNAQDIYNELINLVQITFEVTDACNLQCKYCGYGELYEGYDKRESNFLSYKKVVNTIDYLTNIWNKENPAAIFPEIHISFYGGEPLLNFPLIQKTIDYIKTIRLEEKRKINFSMTTNAMLLDKYMDFLVEHKFELLISLDGDEKGNSYRIDMKGNNSFRRIYRALKKLQTKFPEYFREYISFNSVLHNRNSVMSTIKFIKEEFGKIPSVSELNTNNIACGKEKEFNCIRKNYSQSLLEWENTEEEIQSMNIVIPDKERLVTFLKNFSGNFFYDYNDLLIPKSKHLRMQTGTCIPFGKKVYITVNGKILPCERIDHKFYYGHVTEENVMLDCEQVAVKFNEYLTHAQHLCNVCKNVSYCKQCVYKIDALGEEKIKCSEFLNEHQLNNQRIRNYSYLAKNPTLYKEICKTAE